MKKMSKRKKIVFGSIGAGAVVIVAAVTAVFLFGATPQKRVLRAISYTYGNDDYNLNYIHHQCHNVYL